jgi:pyruvate/2-oxoglutarate dehydrogenase complex dihydrolipoamide acyltransferase (E2) component
MVRVTGPAVHRLLEQFGLNASDVPATGPKGNLLKGDILNMVNQKGLQPKQPKSGTKINLVLNCNLKLNIGIIK